MTTIAYKDGVIAYDSQSTAGEVFYSLDHKKRVRDSGAESFFCGDIENRDRLIDWFFDPSTNAPKGYSGQAFVVHHPGVVWHVGAVGDEFFRGRMLPGHCWAIGSGSEFAIGAMDAGATAAEAVKIAARRDVYTGGRIRTYKVGHGD